MHMRHLYIASTESEMLGLALPELKRTARWHVPVNMIRVYDGEEALTLRRAAQGCLKNLKGRSFAFNLGPAKKNYDHFPCCVVVLVVYVLTTSLSRQEQEGVSFARNLLILA